MSLETMDKLNVAENDAVEIECEGPQDRAGALVVPGHPDGASRCTWAMDARKAGAWARALGFTPYLSAHVGRAIVCRRARR